MLTVPVRCAMLGAAVALRLGVFALLERFAAGWVGADTVDVGLCFTLTPDLVDKGAQVSALVSGQRNPQARAVPHSRNDRPSRR